MTTIASAHADLREGPGWYGKVASLGDFAQRRLPPEWVRVCDDWLSGALRGAREHLGVHWLDAYLTAPVLRFAWAPGVADGQWWFGLLMPSCDSVGRYYPLLIAQPRAQAPQDRIALDHLERWYRHLAQAALRTLQGEPDSVEALEAALADAPPWPTAGQGPALAAQNHAGGDHLRLGRAAPLSFWVHALAARELRSRLAGCTLWWAVGEDGSQDCLAILPGLPDGRGFADLLVRAPG